MTDQPTPTSFWTRLQLVLAARKWDAGDLSFHLARAGYQVSPDTIRSWQTMRHTPRADTVYAIADLLDIDARGLFGASGAEPTVEELERLQQAADEDEGESHLGRIGALGLGPVAMMALSQALT